MREIKLKVYNFNELSDEVKQKVIDKWYEEEDYPFLSEDLTEQTKMLLDENNVEYDDLKVYYSLSCSQGDGLCFIGNFKYKGHSFKITHNWRYYFAESVDIVEVNDEGEEIENHVEEFKKVYLKVAKEVEKAGYSILEYRMNFEEFNEMCEANEYEFYENGEMI